MALYLDFTQCACQKSYNGADVILVPAYHKNRGVLLRTRTVVLESDDPGQLELKETEEDRSIIKDKFLDYSIGENPVTLQDLEFVCHWARDPAPSINELRLSQVPSSRGA